MPSFRSSNISSPGPTSHWTLIIGATGILSALLYVAWGFNDGLAGDSMDYHRLGLALAQGWTFSLDGVVSAARPPLYPAFIGVIYTLFGVHLNAVRVAQAILAGLTAVLIYRLPLPKRDESRSIAAGLACALWPVLFAYSSYILSETLFTFLLVLAVSLFSGESSERVSARLLLSGAVVGLASLTRALLLYFPVFWLIWEAVFFRRVRKASWVWAAVAYLVVLPWTVRNYQQFHRFLPVSVGGGYALWAGAQPGDYPHVADYIAAIRPDSFSSVEGDRTGMRMGKALYSTTWPKVLSNLPQRSLHLWFTSHSSVWGIKESMNEYWAQKVWGAVGVKLTGFLLHGVLFLAALWAVFRVWHLSAAQPIIALFFYTWAFVAMTDWGPNRYFVPLIPLMIALIAIPIRHE